MFILDWLKDGVSWVLIQIHQFLSLFLNPDSGWTWTFSIVGLVIFIRILLIPLFVKQIKSQRNLQLIQPQMKAIQKQYAGDREKQSAEMMKLYKETGTNTLASCLPMVMQAPLFFDMFGVRYGVSQSSAAVVADGSYVGPGAFAWSQYAALVPSMHDSTIFGVPLYGTFIHADATPNPTATHILCVILIILMTATTFLTQRQLIVKNSAPDNPMVKQQKILLYVFPIMFMISGINFPIGVLIYWFTTNLWSMGQQFYVIRNNPQPGTPAFDAKEARTAAKANRKLGVSTHEVIEGVVVEEVVTPRTQPKKTSRSQRKRK